MKKITILGLIVIAAITLLSCSNVTGLSAEAAKAEEKGFTWADAWYIDGNNHAWFLDRMTGNFVSSGIDDNVSVIEGSIWDSWDGCEATFYINTNNEIFQHTADGWVLRYGCWNARDVGSRTIESTFAINTNGQIHKFKTSWNGFEWFDQIPEKAAEKVEVDENGNPWVITTDSKLYKHENGVWTEVETKLASGLQLYPEDLGCGNGTTYILAYTGMAGGGAIYELKADGTFEHVTGSFLSKMDVDNDGTIYYTDLEHGWLHSYYPSNETTYRFPQTMQNPALDLGM